MAVEAKRGCGYRKVGGLYMVSGGLATPCGRLPIELHVCPTCNAGIKQTRAWQWIKPRTLLADAPVCSDDGKWRSRLCSSCPLAPTHLPERAGLLWVGEKFYRTADAFMEEANRLGVSRRIPAIPRGFKLGETWVLIAHPKAVTRSARTEEERHEWRVAQPGMYQDDVQPTVTRGGIVTMFKPRAIERICAESERANAPLMAELAEKGITPVFVPDDDEHHRGSVHDDDTGGES